MDKKLLYKYINGQTSEQEEKTIVDWLDADPNNQKELNALWSMQDAIIANAPYQHHNRLHLPTRRPKWYRQRFIRICTQLPQYYYWSQAVGTLPEPSLSKIPQNNICPLPHRQDNL